MDLFVRIFVRLLDYTYGKKPKPADYHRQPQVDALKEADELIEGQRRQQIVDSFKSTATPVQGAIDYEAMPWSSFERVVETAAAFTFYSGPSVAKMIEKSQFTNPQEIEALRRMARRYVPHCKLLDR